MDADDEEPFIVFEGTPRPMTPARRKWLVEVSRRAALIAERAGPTPLKQKWKQAFQRIKDSEK